LQQKTKVNELSLKGFKKGRVAKENKVKEDEEDLTQN
jgi:hypothetical protein